MRDLDEKGMLRHDFLLVHGDLVGNVDLQEALDVHKKKVEQDKNCIMTQLYLTARPGHPLRTRGRELVIATDK